MAKLIESPKPIQAAGTPPKYIEEFIGRVNSNTEVVSIARMRSPSGWEESGQAIIVHAGEWVQYSTPSPEGAEYIAVCLPAFSPGIVKRDEEERPRAT